MIDHKCHDYMYAKIFTCGYFSLEQQVSVHRVLKENNFITQFKIKRHQHDKTKLKEIYSLPVYV